MGLTTLMGTKKRAAVASTISGMAGTATGLAASHYGADATQSFKIGCLVSGAVGDLLFQAFRLTSDNGPGAGPALEEPNTAAIATPEASSDQNAPTVGGDSNNINAANGSMDTGNSASEPGPSTGPSPYPKHPKHRQRHRAAHRRVERRQLHETKQGDSTR